MSKSDSSSAVPSLARDHAAARAVAEEIYRGEALSLPPVPASLQDRWFQVAPTEFASQPWPEGSGLYGLDAVFGEILSGQIESPFVAFGFGGHGFASHAVHLYFATPQVVALIQMRWSSVLEDPASERKRYQYLMRECRKLDEAAAGAAGSGRFPSGRRIVVKQSSFTGGCWAWVPSEGATESGIEWRRHEDLSLFSALVEVQKLDREQAAKT